MRRTVTTTLLITLAIVLSSVGVALATGPANPSPPPAAPSPLPPVLKPGATTMSVAPSSLSADSTTTPLVFTFHSGGNLRGTVQVTVPAGWSPPQVDDALGAGLLAVDSGDCRAVGEPVVSGSGPWTVSMDIACTAGRSFTLSYGAAGLLTPASTVDTYPFPTAFIDRSRTTSIEPPPAVRVTPGAAATLHLDHPTTVEAGVATGVSLTVKDEFANTATGYTGTVEFTSTDAAATLPDPVTFTAEDAGTITLSGAVTHRTAGTCSPSVFDCSSRSARTLAVADASHEDLSAGVDVTVTPGPVARLSASQLSAVRVDPQLPSTFVFWGPSAFDAYDNRVTDQLDVRFSAGPGGMSLVGNPRDGIVTINRAGEIAFPMINFTSASAGVQTITWELVGRPEVSHSQTVVVYDARTATLEVEDPYFTGVTRFRVNPLVAWQGPPLPGVSTAPKQQPILTVNGKTYQLGELTVAPDGRDLVWDLNPPASVSPSDPEHTLHRCDGRTVCTIDGIVVGESTATFDWTLAAFADLPPLQAHLNLNVVGDGREAAVRPDLTGDIPFTLNLVGLNITEDLFVPWNTSLTVTSVGDNGLVDVLVPLASGGTVETTLSLFSSASLVAGSQLFLEQPLEVVAHPVGTFDSVRVLQPPPPPPGDLGDWVPPPLFASTGVLFNLRE